MMRTFFKKYALLLLLVSSMLTYQGTCNIDTADIVRAVDNAIESLNQNSAEWQTIMNRLLTDLQGIDSSLASLIRVEVQNLLDRGVAVIGAEFRCNVDFIGNRMRNALLRIKHDNFDSEVVVPPLKPFVCAVVPSSIDRILVPDRLNLLEFFGYDFDLDDVSLYVQRGSGGLRENVSEYLDKPTHYHMTVDLGIYGLELTDQDDKLVLIHNFEEIAVVKIIQGSTEIAYYSPGSRTFVPPHTRGDTEFARNGPAVSCRVEWSLGIDGTTVVSTIEMSALETGGDETTAEGTDIHTVYTALSGKVIKEIVGVTVDEFEYIDSNTTPDWFPRGSGGPVSQYEFVGDSEGVDAGTDTRVTVEYNRLTVELTAP